MDAEVREAVGQGGSAVQRNASSFTMQRWQDHFETLGKATVLADTGSRALHYWSADGADYRLYPTSVPMTDELTRRGYTEVVRLLALVNERMWMGHFDLWSKEGVVIFRHTQLLAGEDVPASGHVQALLSHAAWTLRFHRRIDSGSSITRTSG